MGATTAWDAYGKRRPTAGHYIVRDHTFPRKVTHPSPLQPLSPMADARSTLADFAPHVPTSVLVRAASVLRTAWITFITDNPLTWSWEQGRRNERADMEGMCERWLVGCHSVSSHASQARFT